MSIRAVVVDDFGVVRGGVKLLLDAEEDIEVVGEADDLDHAVSQARSLQPDIVLLDLVMHGQVSLEAIPALREAAPQASVLVLSTLDDPSQARDSFGAGASGYVLKEAPATKLLDAVREVSAGARYLDPSVGARLALVDAGAQAGDDPLGEREREVLRLLSLGHTCAEIATMLQRSPRTVELYRSRIMEKLGLETRAQLVHYALEHGLLEESPS